MHEDNLSSRQNISRHHLVILLGFLVAAGTIAGIGVGSPQKPVLQKRLYVDGGRVPASFEELWQQSDAIIQGVVEGADALPEPSGGPHTVPTTRCAIRLVDVFKSDSHAAQSGQTIYVLMIGAVRDRGSHIERFEDPDSPLLGINQHPILFLKWQESEQAFVFATGTPDSAYIAAGALIESHGRSSLARQLKGMSYGQLKAQLRVRGGAKSGVCQSRYTLRRFSRSHSSRRPATLSAVAGRYTTRRRRAVISASTMGPSRRTLAILPDTQVINGMV